MNQNQSKPVVLQQNKQKQNKNLNYSSSINQQKPYRKKQQFNSYNSGYQNGHSYHHHNKYNSNYMNTTKSQNKSMLLQTFCVF